MEYFLAAIMGFILGVLGGGGSILTVPILVYAAGVEPVKATGYSLFIVGITALTGVALNLRNSVVQYKQGLLFALPVFFVVYPVRSYILPLIPETFSIGSIVLIKSTVIMLFFALVMFAAGVSMLLPNNTKKTPEKKSSATILYSGLSVGMITSFVGAGGGFLIVPSLVLLLRLPMPAAVGTSLFIIAINSVVGFAGELASGAEIQWNLLWIFSAVSIAGMAAGSAVSKKIQPARLKTIFAYFILAMSGFIALKETFFAH